MTGCSAINCSNSTEKGYLLKRFPRDPQRRKQWLIRTKRGNWTPTDNSHLCEVHFLPEMWEKTREDGSRKLKLNAVPTVFSFVPQKTTRKPPLRRKLLSPKADKMDKPIAISQQITIFESAALRQPSAAIQEQSTSQSPTPHSSSSKDTTA